MRDLRRHNDKSRFFVCVDQGESILTPEDVTLSGGAHGVAPLQPLFPSEPLFGVYFDDLVFGGIKFVTASAASMRSCCPGIETD